MKNRTIEQNVLRFRAYLAEQAALLLASDDADTRAKGQQLLTSLLVDKKLK